MKIRRDVLLVILIPLLFVASIRFIMALTMTDTTLEEKITLYDVDYVPSDFELDLVFVRYSHSDELDVDFQISGGDGEKDLSFKIYCQDLYHDRLYSSSPSSGTLSLFGVNSVYFETYSIEYGDAIGGEIQWEDMPPGEQIIRMNVQLDNIYLDTWTFYAEMRNQ